MKRNQPCAASTARPRCTKPWYCASGTSRPPVVHTRCVAWCNTASTPVLRSQACPAVVPVNIAGPLKPAAVLILVVASEEGARVLMTRRADSLARHTGQIAFPGGRLDPASVEVLGLSDAYETGTGYLVTPVVGWLEAPPTLTPSPAEVAEVFEVPWDVLMDPASLMRDHLDTPAGVRRWFWSVTYGERYIWGVTAGIVRALRLRLYGEEGEPALATAEDAA